MAAGARGGGGGVVGVGRGCRREPCVAWMAWVVGRLLRVAWCVVCPRRRGRPGGTAREEGRAVRGLCAGVGVDGA